MLSESLADKFGSRRGFIRHCRYSLFHKLGCYQCYQSIDWNSIDRLVFVCKGNICRSAFAEAVAIKEGMNAVSCGIDTIESAPANKTAITMAEKLGYDLRLHRTSPIQQLTFSKADLLISMEPAQAEFLSKHLEGQYHSTLLGLWSYPVLPYIHDPYGADEPYFRNCFDTIKKSVSKLVLKSHKTES